MNQWFCFITVVVLPDMNPIGHLWAVLKSALFHRFPGTTTLPAGVKTVMETRISLVWLDIGEDVLNTLIERKPQRIAAERWYTRL
jgi:transposase